MSFKGNYGFGYAPGATTNREVFGTWIRPFDFTLTYIGYTVGIHDFWRFPYLCYKFGAVFIIPFLTLTIIIGIPSAFMEFTIGQFRGIGATEVFGVLAPILTGISYLLAWNSLITCWVYTMMISWSRLYSSDATSCTQAWGTCTNTSYYNTEACYTGSLDNGCESEGLPMTSNSSFPVFYYDYHCMGLEKFCSIFKATPASTGKFCIDVEGNPFSIYARRIHASVEYYYGGVCGLKRLDESRKPNEAIRHELMEVDVESMIESEISFFSFTTFALLAFFLYEDLLSVSVITYILNGIPFFGLGYFTYRAFAFRHSGRGIQELYATFYDFHKLLNPEIWVEAVIQILSTYGIGNGVLINLTTFNKLEHYYLSDGLLAAVLNCACSFCAAVICFCTIGEYLELFDINVPFSEFITSKSSHSSLEFGYIVYTQYIAFLSEEHYTIIFFFFMITSFSMDSALRLVQNLLDALTAIFARLRRHRFATLVGICLFGFLAILPMTKNGGVILFMEYEYFLLKFVWPIILLVEVVGVTWVYRTSRLLDNAEQMGVNLNKGFRLYFTVCLQYLTVILLISVLGYNVVTHHRRRFNNVESAIWNEIFGWVFVFTPIVLFLLSILEQLISTKRSNWKSLFVPVRPDATHLNVGRHSGISASLYGSIGVHEEAFIAHKALWKWERQLRQSNPGLGRVQGSFDHQKTQSQQLEDIIPLLEIPSTVPPPPGHSIAQYKYQLKEYFNNWPGRFDESDFSGDD